MCFYWIVRIFFLKQKPAYEMRISDWSSDVCPSDLLVLENADRIRAVSYGRWPDAKTIKRFKDAGVLCMPTVGALKHAVKAVELGADIITVQGAEDRKSTRLNSSH